MTGEIANRAFGGGLAYHADLAPNWNFVARLGLAQVRTKVTGTIAGLGSASDSDSNVAAYAGLGVGYKLSNSMSLDFAWDASRSKYDKYGASESGSIGVLTVGLTLGF